MRRILTAIVVGIVFLQTGAATSAQNTACPDLPPRLTTGGWARVTSGTANNLRAEPSLKAERVGRIRAGDIFRVLDGPRCADNYVWWQVKYDGTSAWTAEGRAGEYWLEALPVAPEKAPLENIAGCEQPPETYDQFQINRYAVLNLRTLAMLDHAQELYSAVGGVLRFRDGIMQGSYNPGGVAASFGTHDGGGALDLSVRDPDTRNVLTDEIPLMIRALRIAGFAAWLRSPDELYPGSPIHIHAIAVGDAELSEAARGQLDGTFGYFRGFNGLPQVSGIPLPDTSGEMVVCQWMLAIGFHDMRQAVFRVGRVLTDLPFQSNDISGN
jgi:hypothetical protein